MTTTEIEERHNLASRFYKEIFVDLLGEITNFGETADDLTSIADKDVADMVVEPGGLIDFGAHYTKIPLFHNWSISRSYYWQEHLFELKKFEEAAHITNSICFALARKGYSRAARELLARNVMVTDGLHKPVALANLATLLREQQEHQQAMRLYWQALGSLIRLKATPQLAAVFSEMSNIYRDQGQLLRALAFQELSRLLRLLLKDLKGSAICNNQLSILYRSMQWYGLALKCSKSAEDYWRSTEDEVNLAKTLVTQGNLFNIMGKPDKALKCFNESLEINIRIENLAEAASSMSGKARSYLNLRNFAEAKILLEEAITLRQRASDHRIGIEYENMGVLYHEQGNLALALRWYEKALPYLEKYQPGKVYQCRQKVTVLQKQLNRARKNGPPSV